MRWVVMLLAAFCALMSRAQAPGEGFHPQRAESPYRVDPGAPLTIHLVSLPGPMPGRVKVRVHREKAGPLSSVAWKLIRPMVLQPGHMPAQDGEGIQALFEPPQELLDPSGMQVPESLTPKTEDAAIEGFELVRVDELTLRPAHKDGIRKAVDGSVSRVWEARLPGLKPGFHLLEVSTGDFMAMLPCHVTGLILSIRGNGPDFEAQVLRARTGERVPDPKIFRWESANLPGEGKDASLTPWEPDAKGRFTGKLEGRGAFVAVAALAGGEAVLGSFRDQHASNPYAKNASSADGPTVYAFTERPIYRPGDEVFLRAQMLDPGQRDWKGYSSPYWVVEGDHGVREEKPDPAGLGLRFEVHAPDRPYGEPLAKGTALLADEAALSFAGRFRLPATARPGTYRLAVHAPGYARGTQVPFEVRRYEKPRFTVRFEDAAGKAPEGQLRFRLLAQALHGGPVAGGRVEWHFFRVRTPESKVWWERPEPILEHVDSGEGRTDAEGRFQVDLASPAQDEELSFRLLAQVTDAGGQRQSALRTLGKESGSLARLRVEIRKSLLKPGEPLSVACTVEDGEGKSVQVPVDLELRAANPAKGCPDLWSGPWAPGGSAGRAAGPRATFRLPAGAYLVQARAQLPSGEKLLRELPVLVAGEGTSLPRTDGLRAALEPAGTASGRSPLVHVRALALLPRPGLRLWWTLSGDGKCLRGERLVRGTATLLELPLPKDFPRGGTLCLETLDGERHEEVRLMLDPGSERKRLDITLSAPRSEYRPGETLRLGVSARDAEGGRPRTVLSVAVVDEALFSLATEFLPDPVPLLPVDVQDTAWSRFLGEGHGVGHFDDTTPLPLEDGRLGTLGGTIRSKKGNPLAGALVVLESPALHTMRKVMTGEDGKWRAPLLPCGLYTVTVTKDGYATYREERVPVKRNPLFRDITLRPVSQAAATVEVVAGAYSMDESAAGPSLRSTLSQRAFAALREHFLDTALWNPNLILGGKGPEAHGDRAELEVPLPDDLSSWRATAVGFTADGKAGIGRLTVKVNKPLQLNLVLPQTLTEGDETRAILLVQNRTQGRLSGTAFLEMDGVKAGGGRRAFTLQPGGEQRLAFTLEAPKGADRLVLRAGAVAGDFQDGERREVEVLPPTVPCRIQEAITLEGGRQTRKLTVPAWASEGGTLSLHGLNGGLEQLAVPGLRTLIRYPYGCMEQTLSSFVPNLLVAGLVKRGLMPPLEGKDFEDLELNIQRGVEKVYAHQMESGAWGWYGATDFGGSGIPHTTGYAVSSLAAMKRLGYPVEEARLQNGLKAAKGMAARLAAELKGKGAEEGFRERGDLVFLLGCLAQAEGAPSPALDLAVDAVLLNTWKGSTVLSQVAYAAVLSRHPKAAQLLDALERAALKEEPQARWSFTREYDHSYLQGDVYTTVSALRALCAGRPASPLIPAAESFLLANFDGTGWNGTWATSQVIALLPELAKVRPLRWKGAAIRARVAGGKAIDLAEGASPVTLPVRSGERVELEAEGRGVLLCVLGADTAQPMASPRSGDLLPRIRRELWKLEAPRGAGAQGWTRKPAGQELKVGDELLMEVELGTNKSLSYGLVELPVPAGFEAITDLGDFVVEGRSFKEQDRFARVEPHPDRVAFLLHWLEPGQPRKLRLRLRAKVEGRYTLRPAAFRLMNEESVWASTESRSLVVRPETPLPAAKKGGLR